MISLLYILYTELSKVIYWIKERGISKGTYTVGCIDTQESIYEESVGFIQADIPYLFTCPTNGFFCTTHFGPKDKGFDYFL